MRVFLGAYRKLLIVLFYAFLSFETAHVEQIIVTVLKFAVNPLGVIIECLFPLHDFLDGLCLQLFVLHAVVFIL